MNKKAKKGSQMHDFAAMIKLMKPYLKENALQITVVMILVLVSNALLLAIPIYTADAIDSMMGESVNFTALESAVVSMIVFAVFGSICSFARDFLMVRVSQRFVLHLRRDVFSHMLKMRLCDIQDSRRGDIINRVSVDIEQVSTVISTDIVAITTGIINVLGSLYMMLYISPVMAAVYVIIIPALFFVAKFISKRTKAAFAKAKEDLGALSGHVEEMFAADKTIKMFALENKNYKDFSTLAHNFKNAAFRAEFIAGFMVPCCNFLNHFGFVMIAVIGCILVTAAKISVGDVSGFVIYSKKFTGPIIETANIYNTLQSALTSCNRILYIFDAETEPEVQAPDYNIKGDFEFENVKFGYVPGVNVLKGINLKINAGEKVAIVGSTGCGKTTLITLLMRFYDVNEGRITIDGRDIKEYNLDNLRKNFGMVLQENFLFDMSVANNIDYGLDCKDMEQIISATKEVGMHKFVENLEEGYDTMLSYENTAISQGQTQLLVIARAMLLAPNVYIFDEATSNVDVITERKIKRITNKIMEGKTAFIIAHRLSTITSCDKIMVMDAGELVEVGNHEELMARKGLYYNMINAS